MSFSFYLAGDEFSLSLFFLIHFIFNEKEITDSKLLLMMMLSSIFFFYTIWPKGRERQSNKWIYLPIVVFFTFHALIILSSYFFCLLPDAALISK